MCVDIRRETGLFCKATGEKTLQSEGAHTQRVYAKDFLLVRYVQELHTRVCTHAEVSQDDNSSAHMRPCHVSDGGSHS